MASLTVFNTFCYFPLFHSISASLFNFEKPDKTFVLSITKLKNFREKFKNCCLPVIF